jgi:hypothetical protein
MKNLSIQELIDQTKENKKYFLGYPWNQKIPPFSKEVKKLLDFTTTNI